MRRLRGAVVAALAVAALPAGWAASAGAAPADAYGRCLQRAATTLDTIDCTQVELRRLDPLLTGAERRLSRDLTPAHRVLLATAQRRWAAFRDAECALAGSKVEGGSLQPVTVADCRIRLTRARIAQLQAHLRP